MTSPRLAGFRTVLTTGRLLPSFASGASGAIQRLHRLSELLDWERNMIFAPISALISWPLHIAAAIEGWRREFGTHVPEWLAIVGEYEALHSLAAYTYEHPSDPFPVLKEDGAATFEGVRLGHPLVAAGRMVRNDVLLTRDVRMLIVSGSNMSGKSTLLRTVGVNVILAMAGAPSKPSVTYQSAPQITAAWAHPQRQ